MSKKKNRVRLQSGKITAVAASYGLPGNIGFKVIAAAIAHEKGLHVPHKREDAKALIASHPLYGTPVPEKPKRRRPETKFAATDAFLESYEWRRIRMVVLKRDGARCGCCGATPECCAKYAITGRGIGTKRTGAVAKRPTTQKHRRISARLWRDKWAKRIGG